MWSVKVSREHVGVGVSPSPSDQGTREERETGSSVVGGGRVYLPAKGPGTPGKLWT